MSIKLGGSKSKTSTTSNSSFSNTTAPIVPEWGSTLTQEVAGRVGDVNRLDAHGLVAPANGLQARAAAGAEGLSGMPWNFDAAADLMRGVAGRDANTYAPSYGAAGSYQAAQGSGAGYDAGQMSATSYAPALGAAAGYEAASYGGARLGPVAQATSQSLLDNLDAYASPYRRGVVDAALADYDFGAGQTRAQLDLDLAGAGAFGGSGAALSRSMTEDALTRGRATTSANLLDQMFGRAAGLSNQDADRRQQVSLANAAAANQGLLAQAGFDQEAGLANAAGLDRARSFGAAAQNQSAQANVDALNRAGEFGASAANQIGLANLAAANQAAEFGASARNQFGLENLRALNAAGEFNASAANQFGLANMAAANEAGRNNAAARDQALQRQMDAARGLVDLSSAYEANQRANIATQSAMGGTLREIEQQQRQAPISHAQQVVAMLSGLPISLFTGQQQSGTSSETGVSKTKGVNFEVAQNLPGAS